MKIPKAVKVAGIALAVMVAVFMWGCAPFKEGDYRARVVDAESGAPLEGVVVLGVWYKEYPTLAGSNIYFYDARETVTDAEGIFVMKGMGKRLFTNLDPVRLHIFKAGYEYTATVGANEYAREKWSNLKGDKFWEKRVAWEGDMPVLKLRKLSMEERKRRNFPHPPTEAAYGDIKLYLREANRERTEQGYAPIDLWHGERINEKM
jgi:hypothetical protein